MTDVLGQLFEGTRLRTLLIDAIRYGDSDEVKQRLTRQMDYLFDPGHMRELVERNALAHDAMDASRRRSIREEMERAEARRLQPHYIESFFLEAFRHLGGTIREREPRRYAVTHVPATVRNRDRLIDTDAPLLRTDNHLTANSWRTTPQIPPALRHSDSLAQPLFP